MRFASALLVIGFTASTAGAATVSDTDSIAVRATNWTDSMVLDQFDPSLGTLNSVSFSLTGNVAGSSGAESTDSSATTVTLNLGAIIKATTTSGAELAVALPVSSNTVNLDSYDGTVDFAGTSGVLLQGLSATDTDTNVLHSGFGAFVGAGTININLEATGSSNTSGAGNLITQFQTDAAAEVTVIYDYTPLTTVPVPAGAPLLVMGLGGLAWLRRRA